jgi:hypothetical protein
MAESGYFVVFVITWTQRIRNMKGTLKAVDNWTVNWNRYTVGPIAESVRLHSPCNSPITIYQNCIQAAVCFICSQNFKPKCLFLNRI